DGQDRTGLLDPVALPVLIDEGHHHFARRSSSAWAKNAAAFFKISLARFSSNTSRWSRFNSARSSVLSPGRSPRSRSAWRTHRRNASVEMPSFSPTERIVAHCDGCSAAWSNTIRTARSRSSGEYLLGRPMGPILSLNGPSDKPGTIHFDNATMLSHVFNRSPAIRRNFFGHRPLRCFPPGSSFPRQCASTSCLKFGGHSISDD